MGNLFETLLVQPLFNLLVVLTTLVPGHSLGWGILFLTLIIRALLIPSSAHAIRQQHKMQAFQPELKKIQEQYKHDKETQAREVMSLYKKYDVHPLGSCLPLIIQLPILYALYAVFRDGVTTERFDLLYGFVSHPATMNTYFLGIDLAMTGNILLAVVTGATQFFQTRMLIRNPRAHQPETEMQRIMNQQLIYVMPLVLTFVAYSLPAALALYMVVTSLFSIGQQWWLFRTFPQPGRIPEVSASPDATTIEPTLSPATLGSGKVTVTVRKKGSR
ncbi:YidC/Oxa1 family membrane protein insertase [Candidatus Berkelbacteria bacterium]|nr:YidC/Oxa1 family membrane protein insertase [Candidatus Berkelbacteria bacterium]